MTKSTYLLDTNVLSENIRIRPNSGALDFIASLEGFSVSAVSIAEIEYGLARLDDLKRMRFDPWFNDILKNATILPVDAPCARLAGHLRARRESRGRKVSLPDMLICASAIAHGLTVVTRNLRDFEGCGVAVLDPFT